jgi:hypothetical protein
MPTGGFIVRTLFDLYLSTESLITQLDTKPGAGGGGGVSALYI